MAEVDSFEIELAEQIKNLQQTVLKNIIDLDDDIRSIVFSRFQSIKYKRLSAEQFRNKMNVSGALAFYSPNDNTIYIQSKDNVKIDDVALLHEILHALSSTPYDAKTITNNHSGFKSLSVEKANNTVLWSSELRGINEAATEYFAEKFFGKGNTLLYPFEVHIFSILRDECDYKELKNAYFSNDVKGFKETIKKGFNLESDVLVNQLFSYLDIFGIIHGRKATTYFSCLSLVKNCYSTLLQMKLSKMLASSALSRDAIIEKFDAEKYLLQNYNKLVEEFFKDFIFDISTNKKTFMETSSNSQDDELSRRASLLLATAIMNTNVDFIEEHLQFYKENALGILKQFCSENIYCKYDEITGKQFHMQNDTLIDLFLGILHNKDDKIDLSKLNDNEKYQVISLALYNKYDCGEKTYKHFYPKDLVHFINNGIYDCDIFTKPKLMEYIMPSTKELRSVFFRVRDFAKTYQDVKVKSSLMEKTMEKSE